VRFSLAQRGVASVVWIHGYYAQRAY